MPQNDDHLSENPRVGAAGGRSVRCTQSIVQLALHDADDRPPVSAPVRSTELWRNSAPTTHCAGLATTPPDRLRSGLAASASRLLKNPMFERPGA